MKKIIVFGGSGFIGTHLSDLLAKKSLYFLIAERSNGNLSYLMLERKFYLLQMAKMIL